MRRASGPAVYTRGAHPHIGDMPGLATMPRRRCLRWVLLALGVAAVAGCAAGLGTGDLEIAEIEVESGRYWISVAGSSQLDRRAVEAALLRRAAEIAVATGHDSFVVEDQQTRSSERPVYIDIQSDFPSSTSGRTVRIARYTTIGIVAVFSGQAAPVEGRVFDARAVLAGGAPG